MTARYLMSLSPALAIFDAQPMSRFHINPDPRTVGAVFFFDFLGDGTQTRKVFSSDERPDLLDQFRAVVGTRECSQTAPQARLPLASKADARVYAPLIYGRPAA